MLYCIAPIHL